MKSGLRCGIQLVCDVLGQKHMYIPMYIPAHTLLKYDLRTNGEWH
jgi:hypothetical protein